MLDWAESCKDKEISKKEILEAILLKDEERVHSTLDHLKVSEMVYNTLVNKTDNDAFKIVTNTEEGDGLEA